MVLARVWATLWVVALPSELGLRRDLVSDCRSSLVSALHARNWLVVGWACRRLPHLTAMRSWTVRARPTAVLSIRHSAARAAARSSTRATPRRLPRGRVDEKTTWVALLPPTTKRHGVA